MRRDHPKPSPPEDKTQEEASKQSTPKTIEEELREMGIEPLVPPTPEERAEQQADWRRRLDALRKEQGR